MDVPSIEALEGSHVFPGWYTIKAFGPGEDSFRRAADLAVAAVVPNPRHRKTKVRESSGGKHACVTLEVRVKDAAQVQDLYRAICEVDGLRMIL